MGNASPCGRHYSREAWHACDAARQRTQLLRIELRGKFLGQRVEKSPPLARTLLTWETLLICVVLQGPLRFVCHYPSPRKCEAARAVAG
jgi:hypothetical protein